MQGMTSHLLRYRDQLGNDTLTGNVGGNTLDGQAGNDVLVAGPRRTP